MVNVLIYKTEAAVLKGFLIKGHAGFDESGKDIVCSAVSVLSINLINSLETFTEDEIDYSESDGELSLFISSNPSKEAELLLKAYELGIASICDSYDKRYIRLKYKEVD